MVNAIVGSALSLAVFVVHPVHYMLSAPYWFDESWVVLSTRVSLTKLPLVSWVSPIGFTFLLRLVPGSGEERYRLIVLFFAAGSVAAGYLLGRELQLIPVVTGMLVGGGLLLAPMFAQVMTLKPHVGDAFVTLVMLVLLARLETCWTRRRLAALAAAGILGMLLSHTSLFVTAAVVGSLVITNTLLR
jgi:hypothetical protein